MANDRVSAFVLVALITSLLIGCGGSGNTSSTASQPQVVAAPAFSPAAGTYSTPQTVTLSTTTSGASIRYTADGTTPSATSGTLYSSPITVSSGSTTTISAIAYASGYTSSSVVTAVYTIVPVVVSMTAGANIAQAGTTVQFRASVANASNASVTWDVNDVVGGNAALGTISETGLYTAPASVSDSFDIRVTARSVADPIMSASSPVTVFAEPVIGVRVVAGAGEFYDKTTGLKFIPRGNNYVRFTNHMIVPPVNQSMPFSSTFGPGLYDPTAVETALAAMEASGYNLVRILLDAEGATAGIGNPSGPGVSTAYIANVADFVKRAKNHHLYVNPNIDDLPKTGGYQEMVSAQCVGCWPACWNLEYTTAGGITAEAKFWYDFIDSLVQKHAPMDAIFGYELREEYHYPDEINPGDVNMPLLPTTGTMTAANGKTYDMSDPAQRNQLKNDSLIYWTDRTRDLIQHLAPGALVGVGFVTGANPYVPPFTAIGASTADYIDGHTGPGEGTTLTQDMNGWGKPGGPSAKPVILGEFAARTNSILLESDAAAALKAWQVESCSSFGFSGWALWSWDGFEQDGMGFPHWYATRGAGLVNQALSPANRPDPCQN